MAFDAYTQHRIEEYLARAHQTLETGRLARDHEDDIAAVNRAYYAIFYAANALLTTEGLERSKHSGVISAFRQHFVKTGVIEPEFSDFYGEAMGERHVGDYELEPLDYATASRNLEHADKFIDRIGQVLQEMETGS